MKFYLSAFLFFLLLFGFRVPVIANSTVLAGLLGMIGLLNGKVRTYFFNVFKTKFFFRIFVILIFIPFLYIAYITIHGTTGQFLFLKTFFAQFIYVLSAILVSSCILLNDGKDEIRLVRLFLLVFSLQTLIQIASFASPNFYSIISLFQVEEAKEAVLASQKVGLFRGYSLASDLFFGLGTMYGLGFILLIHLISLDERLNKWTTVTIFLLLLIGTIFSARTGFIGLLLAILYIFILKEVSLRYVFQFLFRLLLFTGIFCAIIFYFLPKDYLILITDNVIPFAFEFVISFFDNGTVETGSTNHLKSMLEIPISIETYLFGDGMYINSDGSYYRYTDSGFLRNILFWGFGGLIILLFYQASFFWYKQKSNKHRVFMFLLFLYVFIVEIKGEAIGKIHMLNIFFSCYYLAIRNDKKMMISEINYKDIR